MGVCFGQQFPEWGGVRENRADAAGGAAPHTGYREGAGTDAQVGERGVQRPYHDIDLLLYEDVVMQSPELTLPHPLMTERGFVLEPLAEIAREVVHPVRKQTIGELYSFYKAMLKEE